MGKLSKRCTPKKAHWPKSKAEANKETHNARLLANQMKKRDTEAPKHNLARTHSQRAGNLPLCMKGTKESAEQAIVPS
jgi:hypothetical protein